MPGPTATAGVVGVQCFVGDGSNHRDSGAHRRGGFVPAFKTP